MKTYKKIKNKKKFKNKNSIVRKTKQNRIMLSSNCAVCGQKKLCFIKNQEINNLSSD